MTDMTEQKAVVETPAPAAPTPPPKQQNKAKKKKRKKIIRTLIVLVIVAAALAVGVYFLVNKVLNPPEVKGTPMTAQAYRSSIVSTVEGSGSTKAKDSATISPESGAVVQELYVKEGDYVTMGTQLYRMDDTEARENVQKAQENVNDIQRQLDDIYDSYNDLKVAAPHDGKLMDVTTLQLDQDLEKGATVATLVDDTKLKLSLYFSYAYENDISVGQTAQVSIPATMSTLTGTVETINKVRKIVPEGSVLFEVVVVLKNPDTLTEGMEATAVLKAADGSDILPYESGKFTYYQTTKITTKVSGPVEAFHLLNYADVKQGDLLVQLGAKNNDKEISDKKESLKTAQKSLEEALEKQGNFNATAPIDGTVISCGLIEGGKVEAGQGITIADTSVMTVEIQVDERNIRYVKPGMMVELSQYNENFYSGVVESVSQNANAQNGVATFPVIVKVDNADGSLMSNMYLQYSFVASQSDNTLVVPVQAVKYVSFSNTGGEGGEDGGMMGGEDGGMDGMLPTDPDLGGDMLPAETTPAETTPAETQPADTDLPEDGGAQPLPGPDGGVAVPEPDGGAVAVPMPATGGAVALPAAGTGSGVVAQPLFAISEAIVGGGSGGSSGGRNNGQDDTGTVCFVQGTGDGFKTPPENAILEPDASWEVPEGFWAVPVTVGLADTINVEITSGLNDGDVVFIGYETQSSYQ